MIWILWHTFYFFLKSEKISTISFLVLKVKLLFKKSQYDHAASVSTDLSLEIVNSSYLNEICQQEMPKLQTNQDKSVKHSHFYFQCIWAPVHAVQGLIPTWTFGYSSIYCWNKQSLHVLLSYPTKKLAKSRSMRANQIFFFNFSITSFNFKYLAYGGSWWIIQLILINFSTILRVYHFFLQECNDAFVLFHYYWFSFSCNIN